MSLETDQGASALAAAAFDEDGSGIAEPLEESGFDPHPIAAAEKHKANAVGLPQ